MTRVAIAVALLCVALGAAVAATTTGYTWLPPALTTADELRVRTAIAAFTGGSIAILGRAQEDATVFLVEVTDAGAHAMWCVDMTDALDAVEPATTVSKPFVDVAAEAFARDYDRVTLADSVRAPPSEPHVDATNRDDKATVVAAPPPAPPAPPAPAP